MNVQEFYAAIGGDYKTAVARMMNDDFIKRMLGKFQASNSFDALLNAYRNKDAKSLFEAAHSLKGVSGNLALVDLQSKVGVVVEAVRDYEHVNELNLDGEMRALESAYLLVKSKLEVLLK